eukprot:8846785-Alexandrium_andersonii.AAC.1
MWPPCVSCCGRRLTCRVTGRMACPDGLSGLLDGPFVGESSKGAGGSSLSWALLGSPWPGVKVRRSLAPGAT